MSIEGGKGADVIATDKAGNKSVASIDNNSTLIMTVVIIAAIAVIVVAFLFVRRKKNASKGRLRI